MKSIIKYMLIGIATSMMFFSCNKFLEEKPHGFVSPSNFYKSVDDFDGALKGLYGITNSYFNSGDYLSMHMVFAPYMDVPESAEQTGDVWINNPGDGFYCFRNCWANPYSIIKNVNMILESVEGKTFDEKTKDRIIAEAKFFRAYAYFELVQSFGDVPYRDKVVASLNDVQIPRTPEAKIYEYIFSDILEAELKMPDNMSEQGRINKTVVKAVLARIYLTSAGYPMGMTEHYSKAREKALEVIANPKYSLTTTYKDGFKVKNYTSETIWAILFDSPKVNNGRHQNTAPIGSNTAICLPSPEFINSFPEGDERKEWGTKPNYITKSGKEFVTRPYFNKFINPQFFEDELPATATGELDYHIPLIRLSEMYLIAAEAENEVNGPGNAYQYVNKIRERARIDKANPSHVPDLENLSQEDFRKAIIKEREFELFMEGQDWYTMKRTQTFNRVQKARGSELKVPIGNYNNRWLIPDFEILNNNIPQNPLYK